MAIIRTLPGNPGPVNQGEEIVLAYLAKELPDTIILIPNITINYDRDGAEEHDILAVGPDGVFVIEVKTLAGNVEINEQIMLVDGDQRSNPWNTSRIKAQKLASRLEQRCGREPKVWVEHVVVFSRKPQSIEIAESYESRIFIGAESVVPFLVPPSRLIHHRSHGLHVDRTSQIVDAILGGAELRQDRKRFGEYHARERVNATAGKNQIEYWNAEHRRHGSVRLLQVFPAGDQRSSQKQNARIEAEQRVAIANIIGPSADIVASYECFETDSGEFVLVWPSVDSPSLTRFLEGIEANKVGSEQALLTDIAARKMIEGFASAYSHLHQKKFIFGDLHSDAFVVRPSGRGAIVLQRPLPVESGDQRVDLENLAKIADSIVALSEEGIVTEVVRRFRESLRSVVRAELPSAGWLAAACEVGVQTHVREKKLNDLFSDLREIASHAFGKTYEGINKKTNEKSVVRVEKGRAGESWVERETKILKRTEVRSCKGAVQWLQVGEVEEGFFVETEWLEGVSLATILDAKLLEKQSDAVKATLQLLEILNEIHPDLDALDVLIGSIEGEPTEDQMRKILQIRSQGIAHNHIEPSNIMWIENRGPVLIDFNRAGELGRIIPIRLSTYWPNKDDRAQSNPTADLYAVGLILLAMLTGSLNPVIGTSNTIESRIERVRMQNAALADIIAKAISEDSSKRYRTAMQFIDSLVGLDLRVYQSPQLGSVLDLVREVEELVAARKFDQALEICVKREWYETAEQIKRKKQLVFGAGHELLNVDGVKLIYLGTREVGPGTTGSNRPYKHGVAHVHLLRTHEGGVLEVHTVTAKPIDVENDKEFEFFETWVQGDLEYGLPEHVQMLADRRRLIVNALTKQGTFFSKLVERGTGENTIGDLSYCEIRQLQLKDLDTDGQPRGSRWEASNKKVDESQLRLGANGTDVFELLMRFGALGVGQRELVISDGTSRKGDFCVKFKFKDDAVHVPVLVFLIARFLPLKNKVVAH